jgi:uncharacterized tellurite resistance protein B-like protein
MEMTLFSFEESLAVARLIWILIYSDHEITRNESDFFNQSLDSLNVSQKELDDYMRIPEEEAYELVRNMPFKKRSECARLLRLAFDSDHNIDRIEMKKLNDILTRAELFRSEKKYRKHDDDMLI